MTNLDVHIMLHRLRNWSVRNFTDASGNKCLHFCLPIEENGIDLSIRDGEPFTDNAQITGVGWDFMAIPAKKDGKRANLLYNLVPHISKQNYNALKDRGLIDPERKYLHTISGNITPWKYNIVKKDSNED